MACINYSLQYAYKNNLKAFLEKFKKLFFFCLNFTLSARAHPELAVGSEILQSPFKIQAHFSVSIAP